MKRILITALAAAATFLAAGSASAQETQHIKRAASPLLVIVTSDDAQVQLMSMVLTMQSAQQGAATRVLLCGAAGDMALRDAPKSVTTGQPPMNMSAQGLMKNVIENTNTEVEVCAIYLPGKGLDQSALIDGVTAADPAVIAKMMVDPRTKIASF
ncbi:hypothetical protein ES754_04080 [Psychrobacter frigidicola]|uniref:DsrE family protein n=1 Tax=Psychrobacter frigidicola TaxID=45611 RepID=A0A5C7A8W1_9GAMM|nr:hypothetical protein [Psychrobacter frigidicola]TXD98126.1 hypothetical protein ES754_04080 [Psychrobacter frigidicola]